MALLSLASPLPYGAASAASPALLHVTSSVAANTSIRLQLQPPVPFVASAPAAATPILSFDTTLTYQSIDLGFGGAFTQAAGSQFVLLPAALQAELIQAYFNRTHGHAYNIGRVPINSCDYSQLTYSYDDTPDDYALEQFDTKAAVDSHSILPLIRAALAVTGHERMHLFAAPWSPPAWMKNSNQMNGSTVPCLRNDTRVYTSWALYYQKWLQVYRDFGVELWGLSIQNEPLNNPPWEGCIYSAEGQVRFLLDYLWPTLNATFPHLQLMAWGQHTGSDTHNNTVLSLATTQRCCQRRNAYTFLLPISHPLRVCHHQTSTRMLQYNGCPNNLPTPRHMTCSGAQVYIGTLAHYWTRWTYCIDFIRISVSWPQSRVYVPMYDWTTGVVESSTWWTYWATSTTGRSATRTGTCY